MSSVASMGGDGKLATRVAALESALSKLDLEIAAIHDKMKKLDQKLESVLSKLDEKMTKLDQKIEHIRKLNNSSATIRNENWHVIDARLKRLERVVL